MIISLAVVQYLPEFCILINYNGIHLREKRCFQASVSKTFEFFLNLWGHPPNVSYTVLYKEQFLLVFTLNSTLHTWDSFSRVLLDLYISAFVEHLSSCCTCTCQLDSGREQTSFPEGSTFTAVQSKMTESGQSLPTMEDLWENIRSNSCRNATDPYITRGKSKTAQSVSPRFPSSQKVSRCMIQMSSIKNKPLRFL